jgi:hypothetical protein
VSCGLALFWVLGFAFTFTLLQAKTQGSRGGKTPQIRNPDAMTKTPHQKLQFN